MFEIQNNVKNIFKLTQIFFIKIKLMSLIIFFLVFYKI